MRWEERVRWTTKGRAFIPFLRQGEKVNKGDRGDGREEKKPRTERRGTQASFLASVCQSALLTLC